MPIENQKSVAKKLKNRTVYHYSEIDYSEIDYSKIINQILFSSRKVQAVGKPSSTYQVDVNGEGETGIVREREERQTAAMEEAGGADGGKAEDGGEGGANTSGRGQLYHAWRRPWWWCLLSIARQRN
ncbi:hypothetical protein L1887_38774 [Cichorium endivia]|nr:hypothetical protein L1887_38774 [Cichorium endivia]